MSTLCYWCGVAVWLLFGLGCVAMIYGSLFGLRDLGRERHLAAIARIRRQARAYTLLAALYRRLRREQASFLHPEVAGAKATRMAARAARNEAAADRLEARLAGRDHE